MHRLIYTSRSICDLSAAEMSQILETSRRSNEKDGITGLLVYHNRRVLQVLEGPEDSVDRCFQRIKQDPRHQNVAIMSKEPASSRVFSNWFMGYQNPSALRVTDPNVAMTIERLQRRLLEVADVDTTAGKKAVIRKLSLFLMSAATGDRFGRQMA